MHLVGVQRQRRPRQDLGRVHRLAVGERRQADRLGGVREVVAQDARGSRRTRGSRRRARPRRSASRAAASSASGSSAGESSAARARSRSTWAIARSATTRGEVDAGRDAVARDLGRRPPGTRGTRAAAPRTASSRSGVSACWMEAISPSSCPGPHRWFATLSRSVRCSRPRRNRRAIASSTSSVVRRVVVEGRPVDRGGLGERRPVHGLARRPAGLARVREPVVVALVADGGAQQRVELEQLVPVAVGQRVRSFGLVHRSPPRRAVRSEQPQRTGAVDLQGGAAHEPGRRRTEERRPRARSPPGPRGARYGRAPSRGRWRAGPGHTRFTVMPSAIRSWRGGLGPGPQARAGDVRIGERRGSAASRRSR